MTTHIIPKDVLKRIENNEYYTLDQFKDDVKRYIKACEQERMICNIESVSASGMSRVMRFCEFSFDTTHKLGHILNFYDLFEALGYSSAGKYSDDFRISGCGMDMVFATNYNIIHNFKSMGFIHKKRCDSMAQKTPKCL